MQVSSIPTKVQLPWANNASPSLITAIPVLSQIGVNAGRASFSDGFVPLNFTPVASGGIPPFGADFNGIFNQLSAWTRWQNVGGPNIFDQAFATAVGGYPNGAIVQSAIVAGNFWMSTTDNNTNDPDAGGANWIVPPSIMGTGHWQWRPVAAALPGWVIANGSGIGNAASGALQRANSDVQLAFIYIWNNFSNTQCPVYSGPTPVARGATALADFNANRIIVLPDMRSIGIIGVDAMGQGTNGLLTGVPFVSGSATQAGSVLGENLHTLINNELSSHFHVAGIFDPTHIHTTQFGIRGYSSSGVAQAFSTAPGIDGTVNYNSLSAATGVRVNSTANGIDTTASAGGGAAHNNVQRSMSGYFYIKL